MKNIFLISVLLFSSIATAGTNPVQLFEKKATQNYVSCTAMNSIAMMGNETIEQLRKYGNTEHETTAYTKCDSDKNKIKGLYKSAKKYLKNKNNKDAISELKKYYAYWLTIIESAQPQSYENNNAYDNRVSKSTEKLKERANLLKIELE